MIFLKMVCYMLHGHFSPSVIANMYYVTSSFRKSNVMLETGFNLQRSLCRYLVNSVCSFKIKTYLKKLETETKKV